LDSTPPNLATFSRDTASAEEGASMLGRIAPPLKDAQIFSRVLKDPWHLMHQISLPANHGLRHSFSVTWRDILFAPDADDKGAIERYAIANGTSLLSITKHLINLNLN
jgi:hypothetical protein